MVSFNFKPHMVGLTSALKIEKQTKQISLQYISQKHFAFVASAVPSFLVPIKLKFSCHHMAFE